MCFADVHYGMAGLRRRVQTVRVHAAISERHGKCGSETKLLLTADVQRRVPVLFNGNQTGFTGRAMRVAQVDMHVHDAHQSESYTVS